VVDSKGRGPGQEPDGFGVNVAMRTRIWGQKEAVVGSVVGLKVERDTDATPCG
jgi:hypothetical protein